MSDRPFPATINRVSDELREGLVKDALERTAVNARRALGQFDSLDELYNKGIISVDELEYGRTETVTTIITAVALVDGFKREHAEALRELFDDDVFQLTAEKITGIPGELLDGVFEIN